MALRAADTIKGRFWRVVPLLVAKGGKAILNDGEQLNREEEKATYLDDKMVN